MVIDDITITNIIYYHIMLYVNITYPSLVFDATIVGISRHSVQRQTDYLVGDLLSYVTIHSFTRTQPCPSGSTPPKAPVNAQSPNIVRDTVCKSPTPRSPGP